MASVVSDSADDMARAKASRKTLSVSGSASSINTDQGLLLITPKTKPAQVVAVAPGTLILVRRMGATLADITPGMHVSARLSGQTDGAGHPVAVSLSASGGRMPKAHRVLTLRKKMRKRKDE